MKKPFLFPPNALALLAICASAAIPSVLHAQDPVAPGTTVSTALAGFPDELKQEIKYVFILYPENRVVRT